MVPLGIPLSRFLSWPEEDQDAALAFMRARAEACPNCGTWPDQADQFEPTTIRCRLCEDTERVQADLDEERQRNPDGTRGVRIALRRAP